MEYRKVQESASGSFFITLPKSWVESVGAKKGDRIEMYVDKEASLRLLPQKKLKERVCYCEYAIEDYAKPEYLKRRINNCYMQGTDLIVIRSDQMISSEWKAMLKSCIADLIGTEISEEFSNKMTLRTLVDCRKFPLKELFQRIHTLVLSIHADAIKSFEEYNPDLAIDVIDRVKEVDKLYRLVLRQLSLGIYDKEIAITLGVNGIREGLVWAIAARDLSRIGFYGADIAAQVNKLNGKKVNPIIMGSLITLSNIAREMQEKGVNAFYKDDFALANEVLDKIEWIISFNLDVTQKIYEQEHDPQLMVILTTVSTSIRKMAIYAAAIADDAQIKNVTASFKEL